MSAQDLKFQLADLDLSGFDADPVEGSIVDSLSTRPGFRFFDHSGSGSRSCSCANPCTCAETMCYNCSGVACHFHED
jgi:hypothetical protein